MGGIKQRKGEEKIKYYNLNFFLVIGKDLWKEEMFSSAVKSLVRLPLSCKQTLTYAFFFNSNS